MQDMKGDMSGGAAVIEANGAIAELGLPVRVLAVVAATENMPGRRRLQARRHPHRVERQDDRGHNTDAEGRLVLADALWYAREQGATHILDLATLTGAMVRRARRPLRGLVRERRRRGARRSSRAGEASGDHAWRFPLHPRYRRYVDSVFADMKNSSDLAPGGRVLAAEFLREFAGEGPWAHVDIAGPAFFERSRGDYLDPAGGTGYGVRLIVELATRLVRVNFDLSPEHELRPRHRPRVRARAGRAGRRGARPRAPLPLRARRGAGRARADGHADPRGVRRRRAPTRSRTRSRSRS